MFLDDKIRQYTQHITERGLLRQRTLLSSEHSSLIHFDSNDYLSLIQDPALVQAYQKGYSLYPCGSGGSMVLNGYHATHQAVEKAFAELLAVDECLLFSSGYAANLALTALLGKLNIHCVIDKEVHASIYDGLALAQVPFSRYFHQNLADLKRKLESHAANSVVLTEGTFSMSGQIASLAEISTICINKQSELLVDEAHSFGVIGEQGKGAVFSYGLSQNEVPLRVIPLGKAFAAQGAVIAGKREWIQALLQAGRSLIYSTAISPALSYGLLKTLERVISADDRRVKLQQLIELFNELKRKSSFNWAESGTAIQQLRLGCPHLALHYSQELQKRGIRCLAIRSPTVSKKNTGLRIILNYNHTVEQLHFLFKQLTAIYEDQY